MRPAWKAAAKEFREANRELERRLSDAQEFLWVYGRHLPSCPLDQREFGPGCRCGLNAANGTASRVSAEAKP